MCYSTGYGECLLDIPNGRIYDFQTQLPGSLYDVNKQCELMFGPGSQVCPYLVSYLRWNTIVNISEIMAEIFLLSI